jgi:hypothetical protein
LKEGSMSCPKLLLVLLFNKILILIIIRKYNHYPKKIISILLLSNNYNYNVGHDTNVGSSLGFKAMLRNPSPSQGCLHFKSPSIWTISHFNQSREWELPYPLLGFS